LLLTGVAMTMAEDSAPASGGEHMVSHTLDMMAAKDGVKHDLHGRQVGVGTVLASEIYRRLLEMESPAWRDDPAVIDRTFWGSMADAVEKAYAPKRRRLTEARRVLSQGDCWDDLREKLSTMVRRPQRIHGCLKTAGAACSAADIGITPARLSEALSHAHEIRSRFTILDLARLAGLLPECTEEIIEQWG
jgi:glycerol-1-phosphate dehydrogenase [NAD(P)+]